MSTRKEAEAAMATILGVTPGKARKLIRSFENETRALHLAAKAETSSVTRAAMELELNEILRAVTGGITSGALTVEGLEELTARASRRDFIQNFGGEL